MKPFSLGAVLRYRKQLEDKAAINLGRAQRNLQQKREIFDSIADNYQCLLENLAKEQSDGISIDQLQRYENHLVWVKEQMVKAHDELNAAVDNVNKKRDVVVRKSRERKALENLKTKQNRAWKSYLEKKEAAQLDEIAVLSHDRNNVVD